ncbi:hypothetical protein JCM11251_003104 [Rhodosporidiobolus azoricus]
MLKHTLARSHGPAGLHRGRSQAGPAAKVLVEGMRGFGNGRTGVRHKLTTGGMGQGVGFGRQTVGTQKVIADLRNGGNRPFSTSGMYAARLSGGEPGQWAYSRLHWSASEKDQRRGESSPGASARLRELLFGPVEAGSTVGEMTGFRMFEGREGWKESEETRAKRWAQWSSWLSAKSPPAENAPPPPPSQDSHSRSSPSPARSRPCHPYYPARISSSRAQWAFTPKPLDWLVRRYGSKRLARWNTSTNSLAYADGEGHNHGLGNSYGHAKNGRGPSEHEHRGQESGRVDVASFGEIGSSSSSFHHAHSSSSSHHHDHHRPKSHNDFSTSNHSSTHDKSSRDQACHEECTVRVHWLFAIPANERRRRDPQKRRHLRHMMRTMGTSREVWWSSVRRGCEEAERESGVGVGGLDGRKSKWRCVKRRFKAHKALKSCEARETFQRFQNEFLRRKSGAVLRFREAARRSGAGSSSSSGNYSSSSGSGPFNYEHFRQSIWFAQMHARHAARHYNHHPLGGRGAAFRPRYRHVAPEGWVRWSHARMRNKNGFAFFTVKYSNPRCGTGNAEGFKKPLRRSGSIAAGAEEGALGGSRVALGKPPVKPEAIGAGVVADSYFYRNEVTARLASSAAARMGGVSLLSSGAPSAAASCLSARAFSTSSSRASTSLLASTPAVLSPLHLALPLFLPLASILKSTAALNLLTILTRLSLTLLPLSIRGKLWHVFKARYAADPNSVLKTAIGRAWVDRCGHNLATQSGGLARWNAAVGLPLLLAAPFVLFGLVVAASLERTPVTGRWRVVMLSPAEEADLVDGILAPPSTAIPEGTTRDWVSILRSVLSLPSEGVSPTTGRRILLGGEVLDQRDWRVRWAEAVLRALEKGGELALVGEGAARVVPPGVMAPPPTAYPLEPRMEHAGAWKDELMFGKHLSTDPSSSSPTSVAAAGGVSSSPLKVEYDLLVVDRPDANAFSFGFGPERANEDTSGARRGVIVVYTGFLDEILGNSPPSLAASLPPTPPASPPSPSRSSLFSSLSQRATAPSPSPPASSDPIEANLVPSVLPAQAQTKALAVLLSHELAHLCLDHTLESYASTGLVVPHLMRLGSDVLRTLLYPVTFLLGPFLNDALGRTLNEGALGGFGVIGQAVNSCESRKLESEADRVALRLLAGSGIDPNFALEFWEDRLASSTHSPSSSASSSPSHSHSPLPTLPGIRQHSHDAHSAQAKEKARALDGLLRSHPVDEERVVVIKQELEEWKRWWEEHGAVPAAATMAA